MGSSGIPVGAQQKIEEMFKQVQDGDLRVWELERELNRWGVFEEYQDRFYALVRGMKKKP